MLASESESWDSCPVSMYPSDLGAGGRGGESRERERASGEVGGGLGEGEAQRQLREKRCYLQNSARKHRLSCGRRCGNALYCLSQQALVL